jgi:glutathionyl-hydroquinone reductase
VSIQRAKHSHARKATRPVLYSEQSCFEADRSAVVRELTTVENAIEEDACEMAMIAAEGVFDQQVSRILTGEARAMHRMVRGLKDLRLAVARARRPES